MTPTRKPRVGVLANASIDGDLPGQRVDQKYLQALTGVANVMTLIIPACDPGDEIDTLLAVLDGVVLTGAVSNVHPDQYQATTDAALYAPFDTDRDVSALALLGAAIRRDMPVLAICRGMQELNVCCGGSLAPAIQSDAKRFEHHQHESERPPDQRYAPAHALRLAPDGQLQTLLRDVDSLMVNSLHVQAIDRLGSELRVEAQTQDGTIEAVSLRNRRFVLGVQWHPEFDAANDAISRAVFTAFGAAACDYRDDQESRK